MMIRFSASPVTFSASTVKKFTIPAKELQPILDLGEGALVKALHETKSLLVQDDFATALTIGDMAKLVWFTQKIGKSSHNPYTLTQNKDSSWHARRQSWTSANQQEHYPTLDKAIGFLLE